MTTSSGGTPLAGLKVQSFRNRFLPPGGTLEKEDGSDGLIIPDKADHTRLTRSDWSVPFFSTAVDGVFGGPLVATVAGSGAVFGDLDHF